MKWNEGTGCWRTAESTADSGDEGSIQREMTLRSQQRHLLGTRGTTLRSINPQRWPQLQHFESLNMRPKDEVRTGGTEKRKQFVLLRDHRRHIFAERLRLHHASSMALVQELRKKASSTKYGHFDMSLGESSWFR